MVHSMRRADRAITDPEAIEALLKQGRYVAVALCAKDEPYVVTLSYGYDAQSRRLYFHVAHEGRKLDIIALNPRACATVVVESGYTVGECEHPFQSVVMEGRMRVVTDEAEKSRAIRTLVSHLEPDPEGYWASRSWDLESRMAGFSALAFEIEDITAKRGK